VTPLSRILAERDAEHRVRLAYALTHLLEWWRR
jgi:hypothetical protein